MKIMGFIQKNKRDFNNSVCLMGIIPFLVFLYIMVNKIASFNVFVGEIGFIMLITIIIFLSGIMVGRKMVVSFIRELIEKSRLAAVSETALALSHEINNPLLVVSGNLELLESEFSQAQVAEGIKNRFLAIKDNCERIRKATDKLSVLTKPVSSTIHQDTKMIDLSLSQ